MSPNTLIEFLSQIEKLKCNTRHSWTSSGRHESVAEHSWRLAVIAYLLKNEFSEIDNDKVIKMCLIHDFGEAITGDIPSFYKKSSDTKAENSAVDNMISVLPQNISSELQTLFNELREGKTQEAMLVNALDKLEAVISHNEADISTWLPLEYELNQIYGKDECEAFSYLKNLREILKNNTLSKIEKNKSSQD